MVPAHCLPAEAKKKGDCYKKRRWLEGEGGSRRAARGREGGREGEYKVHTKIRGVGGGKGRGRGLLLAKYSCAMTTAALWKRRTLKPTRQTSRR